MSGALPPRLAAVRRPARLVRAGGDDRARRRVSGPDGPVPVGAGDLRGRRQRDGGALLGRRGRRGQDVGVRARRAAAAVSGVVLAVVQGQGKADLAMGYELDIIASAVVGGASLSGGRGSVIGAVLGTLIFGVLRNALPQIPGATFYDRLIVGARRHRHRRDGSAAGHARRPMSRRDLPGRPAHSDMASREHLRRWPGARRLSVACGGGNRDGRDVRRSRGTEAPLRGHPEIARPSGLQLREGRRRARGRGARERRGHLARPRNRRPAPPEGDPRVVHHAARGWHRDLLPQRRLSHRDHQPRDGRRHSRRDVGLRRAEVEADRVLRRGRSWPRDASWARRRSGCSTARARSRSSPASAP